MAGPAYDPTTPSVMEMMKAGAKGFASDAKSAMSYVVHRGDSGKTAEPEKPAPTISEKVGRKVSPGFGKLLDALGPKK